MELLHRKTRRGTERGTQIELLVVILSIAVLAAVLLPVLARVKRQAAQKPQVAPSARNTMIATQAPTAFSNPASKNTEDDTKLLFLYLGGTFAAMAWSYKQLFGRLLLRAELAILQVLSDGKSRPLSAIASEAKAYYRLLAIIPGAVKDAVASLVSKDKVVIHNGKFQLSENKAPRRDVSESKK